MADKTYRHSVTGAERKSSRILGYPWAEVRPTNGRKRKAGDEAQEEESSKDAGSKDASDG